MLKDYISKYKATFSDHTELRAQVNNSQRVTLLAGNMASNAQSSTGGVSARVYRGGVWGFASGAEYSPDKVKSVLSAATDNAIFMDTQVKKAQPPIPPLSSYSDSALPGRIDLKKPIFETVSQSYLIDFAKTIDEIVEKKYKNITSRTVIADFLSLEKLLCVSDGTDTHSFLPRSTVYVFLSAETKDAVPIELYEPFSVSGKFDEVFMSPSELEPKLDELYDTLMKQREGVYAEAGLHKCILHPDLAGILAHEAVGHTVEADLVLGGSVAGPNLSKQVASELVTMIDYAHTFEGEPVPLPVYVDDEGTVAEDAVLIEKGILKGFLHNRDSAREFDAKPQGNARAFLYSDEPLIRMRNTAILPGKDNIDDLIASVDKGYFLMKTGNGQADSTGEFMFSVNCGYEINKGKLGRAIRETTISGVAFDMLKTVDMVSKDMEWSMSGFCGKKQPMANAMGGPALRCDMNIGGR